MFTRKALINYTKKIIKLFVKLYSVARMNISSKRRILFIGYSPMNYIMFQPLHKRIEEISDAEIFFSFRSSKSFDYNEYKKFGILRERIIPIEKSRKQIWDAVIKADFPEPEVRWLSINIQIYHGIAAKLASVRDTDGSIKNMDYRYHPSLPKYDLVFFINAIDYNNAKALGLLKNESSGEIVGMSCLDQLIRNNTPEEIARLKDKYIPKRYHGKMIIMYAPTWGEASSFELMGREILQVLSRMDAFVIVKPHPYALTSNVGDTGYDLTEYLKRLFPEGNYTLIIDSPYEVLPISDMMISDFSSLSFEYALLRKPIYLFENRDWLQKIADLRQYDALKKCCFVFHEDYELDEYSFAIPTMDLAKLEAMQSLTKAYFANVGFATDIAVANLIKRRIVLERKSV